MENAHQYSVRKKTEKRIQDAHFNPSLWQTGIIYKIKCAANGREYVGRTKVKGCPNPASDIFRLRTHAVTLKGNYHSNTFLQRDWNKYGESYFQLCVLETYDERCFDSDYAFNNFLSRREIEIMFQLNSSYNDEIQQARLKAFAQSIGYKDFGKVTQAIALGEVGEEIKQFDPTLWVSHEDYYLESSKSLYCMYHGVSAPLKQL